MKNSITRRLSITYLISSNISRMGLSGFQTWITNMLLPAYTVFKTAFEVWKNPTKRTKLKTAMLLDAEKTFKMQYRFLYVGMLKENSLTTNADLTAMGLPKRSDGGDITITGSKITANDGSNGDDGDIAISGGKITINSGYVVGAGIVVIGKQAGNATVTITGGNFKMSGANGPQPTNGIGDDVYLNIFTIGDPDVGNDMHVTAGSINIVRTDDGRIYKVILH